MAVLPSQFPIARPKPLVSHDAKTDLNFAALRELDRVSGQVEQDLLQSHPVAENCVGRRFGHAAVEAQPLLARPHGKDPRDLVQHPPQAEGGGFQFQFARLDFGGVEKIVQKRQEQVGRTLRRLQAVSDHRVGRFRQCDVDHAQDGIHGRPQFVADIGEELAFGLIGQGQPFLAFPQGLFGALAPGESSASASARRTATVSRKGGFSARNRWRRS